MRLHHPVPRLLAVLTCGAVALGGSTLSASAHPGHELGEPPPESNFQKVPLVLEVTQPMQLTVAPDGRVFFIERTGGVRIWKPDTGTTVTAGAVEVDTRGESGLQGLALDPDFATNGWVYLYYSSITTQSKVLSRFHVTGDVLDPDSEVQLLEIPTTFPPRPSHVGGSIEFGPGGELWLSTGDDTQPYESAGFTPIDERPGRAEFDAQRSAGNTNDLRGKLLRIVPVDTEQGGYTIPEGNLFPAGTGGTRPEVYAMGFRNPFRMTVDPHTGTVLLADYGPDARASDPARGPEGYVEWQVVSEPGNYGWPYCHGPNLPYVDYDFATSTSGQPFDCDAPVNDSPNNTGLVQLPPVIAPEIAYSASTPDPQFPELGTGGAPMAGPVFHHDPDLDSDVQFPEYYDGHGFFYEWGAHFLATVVLEDGQPVATEPFLPTTRFNAPMDMVFGPDGAMYLAEWGRGFGRNNPDDGIYRIEYAPPGERAPQARATATPSDGQAPLTVKFSSAGSGDPDEGQTLTYRWDFGDGTSSQEPHPTHTYAVSGDITATLTVTDDTGRSGTVGVQVTVGNTSPVLEIVTPVDGGFVGGGETVDYQVSVTDAEESTVDCDLVVVQPAIGHDSHGHPLEEYTGCEGSFTTSTEGHGADANFFYVLNASYSDQGAGGVSYLTGSASVLLQPKHRQAEHYSAQSGISESRSDAFAEGAYRVAGIATGDWIAFDRMNMSGIDAVSYRVAAAAPGTIELRADAPDGPLVASTPVTPTGGTDTYAATAPAVVTDPGGTRTYYVVFTASEVNAFNIDAIDFLGRGVAADSTAPTVAHALDPAAPTGAAGWWTGPVTLTLAAEDDVALASVEVSTDGGATWTSARQGDGTITPLTITQEGITDVLYRATDTSGNETRGATSVRIDTVSPEAAVTGRTDGAAFGSSETADLAFTATDATSGVAAVSATLDGAPIAPGPLGLWQLELGTHTLVVTADDAAGLRTTTSLTFSVSASLVDIAAHLQRLTVDGGLTRSQQRRAEVSLSQAERHLGAGRTASGSIALRRVAAVADDAVVSRDVEAVIDGLD